MQRGLLIFKRRADRLTKALVREGIQAAAIHGNKSQGARQAALGKFKSGDLAVLVATDIAARGIDVDGVSHVINFDLPNEPESYVHRIGRTARAGASGIAISLCSREEQEYLRLIEKLIGHRIAGEGRPADVVRIDRAPAPVQAARFGLGPRPFAPHSYRAWSISRASVVIDPSSSVAYGDRGGFGTLPRLPVRTGRRSRLISSRSSATPRIPAPSESARLGAGPIAVRGNRERRAVAPEPCAPRRFLSRAARSLHCVSPRPQSAVHS
jgi:hypothetical protein